MQVFWRTTTADINLRYISLLAFLSAMSSGEQSPIGRPGLFYNKRYSADDMARLAQANRQASVGNMGMVGGHSLDEIVNQSSHEQQRRRSLQHRYLSATPTSAEVRNAQMMGFNSPSHSDLDGYSFATSPVPHSPTVLANGGGIAKRRADSKARHIAEDAAMGMDSAMGDFGTSLDQISQSPIFQGPVDNDQMNLDINANDFLDMPIDSTYDDAMDTSIPQNLDMFSQPDFTASLEAPLQNNTSDAMQGTAQPPGSGMNGGLEQALMSKMPHMSMSDSLTPLGPNGQSYTPSMNSPSMMQGMAGDAAMLPDFQQSQAGFGTQAAGHIANFGQQPTLPDNQQRAVSKYLNAYSQSGFDMLGILMRVAARPKPQINIGAVDMSCAFVVCDVTQHDIPIVYCSEMFERLTGYVKHEILGRNCRFLQAPDGKVISGIKRKYVDDKSVLYLKNMIRQRQEAQISLINYRKGGQPFMNLLTVIPIAWDTDEYRYFVGFQVDLVEQPTSITNKNPGNAIAGGLLALLTMTDGSYSINYQRGLLPRYVIHKTPETSRTKELEIGHSIERDEVSAVLTAFGSGETDYSKRIWDKLVIENTDDVVHVLSLKGLFQYLSPACAKVLEYEPNELVGTPLSSICHPSDIVPVTRELKDSAPGSTVNVVFRIRRKRSGYTWFESHGSLHTEQGKGKKCIILTGRERPVYALLRKDITWANEIGENELWTKMSTSGMFLFVATHAKSLLDRQPEDMVGSSAQSLMRRESKEEFNRMLELARTGKVVTLKHDIQNRRGQTLHAQSTLYPGDAVEGQKPTFLIVQTKLLKMGRSSAALSKAGSTGQGTPSTGTTIQSAGTMPGGPPSTPANQFPSGIYTTAGGSAFAVGNQHEALASEDNVFDELKTTRSTSWQFELRQMEKRNRVLAEELQSLNSSKKKRKRRKGLGQLQKDCANCHTRNTPEWRRGPSGNRDLCNSCGLRWAKQVRSLTSPPQHQQGVWLLTPPCRTAACRRAPHRSRATRPRRRRTTLRRSIPTRARPRIMAHPPAAPLRPPRSAAWRPTRIRRCAWRPPRPRPSTAAASLRGSTRAWSPRTVERDEQDEPITSLWAGNQVYIPHQPPVLAISFVDESPYTDTPCFQPAMGRQRAVARAGRATQPSVSYHWFTQRS